MDDMDIDSVTEVPDTPDRLAAIHVSQQNEKRSNIRSTVSTRNSHIIDHGSPRCPRRVDTGYDGRRNKRLYMHPPKRIYRPVKSGHRGNPICISPPSNHGFSSGHHLSGQPTTNHISEDDRGKAACTQRSAALNMKGSNGCATLLGKAVPHDNAEVLVAGNRCHFVPDSLELFNKSSKGKEKVCDKGTDMSCNTSEMLSEARPESSRIVSTSRHVGQKRLVRNGCISPNNIATRPGEVDERRNGCSQKLVNGQMNYQVSNDCWLSPEFCQLIAKEKTLRDRNKGKEISGHSGGCSKHDLPYSNISSRNSNIPSCEEGGRTDTAVLAADHGAKLGGWRTTHSGESALGPISDREMDLCKRNNKAGSSVNGYCNIVENESGHHRSRRRNTRVGTSDGGTNAPGFDSHASEVMILGSPANSAIPSMKSYGHQQPSSSRSVINIEDSPLRTRRSASRSAGNVGSPDSDSRARQVEADEILARELQEQLYNESPFVGNEQDDNYVAMVRMMQLEEDAHLSSLINSRHLTNSRDSAIGRAHRWPPPRAFQNPSNRRSAQARVPIRSRLQQPRRPRTRSSSAVLSRERALHFPLDMDLEMRLDVLEALESALGDISDMETPMDFFETQRDFNENDYELLLALDENNIRAGASASQIQSLPVSEVQNDSCREGCAICLEVPVVGDTIRHLPCLHKFHKDCIDPWLSRSRSCPVCKSSIT